MTRLLFPLVFLLVAVTAAAQQPFGIKTNPEGFSRSSLACPPGQGNDAGTFTLGNFNGQSNDIDLDTIFLCFGDEILIDHNGDQDLSGDPNPATQGGVGYAFYGCPPTQTGEELSQIIADPCVLDTTMPPPPGGIWIATGGNTDGDILFQNDGNIQSFFFGGEPGLVWFAPITYDSLDTDSSAFYESDPPGPCVNVNVDTAFAVVYLNAIDTIQTEVLGCSGSILVTGGLPEFENTDDYTVSMTLSTDPGVSADVNVVGVPSVPDQSNIRFRVPEPGIYDVVIEDGKSCPLSFQINVDICQDVTFDIGEVAAPPGSNVCVPVYAVNFESIRSFQFSVHFDNTVLAFSGISNQNMTMTEGGLYPVSWGPADPNINGEINISWFFNILDPDAVTLPDSAVLFEICFDIIGPLGSSSFITIEDQPVTIEVKNNMQGDVNPIDIEGQVFVADILPLLVNVEVDSVSCGTIPPNPPLTDGSITVTPSGGTEPYALLWQEDGGPVQPVINIPGAGQSAVINNLGAGTYYITVEDSQAPPEQFIDTIIITAPVPLAVGPNTSDPLCFGDSTGSFNINVNGGVLPYSFSWNNGDITQNIDSLPAGFYEVLVTDQNGCTATASGSLFNPPIINTDVSTVDATCSGTFDGEATVVASGGTLPSGMYQYAWSTNPIQNTPTATGLDITTYFVTVTDDNGCEVVDSAVIGAATILLANATVQDISCFGLSDGSISTNPTAIGINNGGYTYTWSGGVAGPNDNTATGLPADTFSVVITDAAGCSIDSTYVVNQPDSITIDTVNIMNETCVIGNDGELEVIASGGTVGPGSDYQYNWSNMQMGPAIGGLSAGLYTVTVTDDNNCQDSLTLEVLPPNPPTIDSFQVTDVLCASSTDGSITVFAGIGAAPISTIDWSNGDSGASITGLAPGAYIVTVTDESGCVAIDTAVVGSPPPLQVLDTTFTLPTCNGDCDGSIALQLTGGVEPFTFAWDNNQTTNPAFGLCAGSYSVTITDANDCPPLILTLELEEPDPVTIDFDPDAIQGVTCFDGVPCDGAATATASGGGAGTGQYTFIWESGTTQVNVATSSANNLCQGFQTLTVSDASGCSATDSVNIPSPPPLELDTVATDLTDVSCFGGSDGSVTAVATGGTPDYTYSWIGLGQSGPTVTNLQAGSYDVIINDANGCATLGTVVLEEPDPLMLMLDSLLTQNVTCAGDEDGQIKVVPSGGNIDQGGETYAWSGGISSEMIATNLAAGTYSVTVTDINGCTAALQHTITAPPPIVVEVQDSIPAARCFGEAVTFNIDTIFGGGLPTYETAVNGFDRRQVIGFPHAITMPGGNNVLTVIDGNGCREEIDIFIVEPPEIAIDLGPGFEIALGDTTNTLEAVLLNGQDPATFDSVIWEPAELIGSCVDSNCLIVNINPFDETTYTVTIIDENGCTGMAEVTVTIDKRRNVYIPNVFSPNDDGFNDQWRISAGQDVRLVNFLRLYDRWGELLYEANEFVPNDNSSEFWDGTFRGKKLNPGVFVYIAEIEFVDGRVLLYRGTVTLVR